MEKFKNTFKQIKIRKITFQNVWDTAKPILRRKFIVIQVNHKKQEKSQIYNLTFNIKELEKEEKTTPKVNRRKEIINIRVEIKEAKTKKKNSKDQ